MPNRPINHPPIAAGAPSTAVAPTQLDRPSPVLVLQSTQPDRPELVLDWPVVVLFALARSGSRSNDSRDRRTAIAALLRPDTALATGPSPGPIPLTTISPLTHPADDSDYLLIGTPETDSCSGRKLHN